MEICKHKDCNRRVNLLDKPYCSSTCCIDTLEQEVLRLSAPLAITNSKAKKMQEQGNKLVGYIFEAGDKHWRTCAYGSVRNSITVTEWQGLTFSHKPTYDDLLAKWQTLEDMLVDADNDLTEEMDRESNTLKLVLDAVRKMRPDV